MAIVVSEENNFFFKFELWNTRSILAFKVHSMIIPVNFSENPMSSLGRDIGLFHNKSVEQAKLFCVSYVTWVVCH